MFYLKSQIFHLKYLQMCTKCKYVGVNILIVPGRKYSKYVNIPMELCVKLFNLIVLFGVFFLNMFI